MIIDGAGGKGGRTKPDRSLVRLILTGQSYKDRILKARGQTVKQLADEAGVSRSYFTRALRLTYLAPDIVQAVLSGTQPPELTARKLKTASLLPLNWGEQRALLGFD
ncbi:MAG: AraC family transcriptional regulator [Rhodospirillales bacterium]|nr:AraC family transcriptional regulator [Rhodospirillales bacterium]